MKCTSERASVPVVYSKCNSELVGFVDFGDINNHLLAFEKAVKGEKELLPSLAKTMMVFMVIGLFTPLRFQMPNFHVQSSLVARYFTHSGSCVWPVANDIQGK